MVNKLIEMIRDSKNTFIVQKILDNWRQFLIDMGNSFISFRHAELFVNRTTDIVCNFANCVVLPYHSAIEFGNLLRDVSYFYKSNNFVAYAVQWNNKLSSLPAVGNRCSLAVFQGTPSLKSTEFKVVKLATADAAIFADIVFRSHEYDQKFKKDSERLYHSGMISGRVHLYAVLAGNAFVGGALTHRDRNGMSIRLVNTIPEFRSRGVATFLVSYLVDEGIERGDELIWLYTRKGSEAERLYSKIGFSSKYEMNVIRNNSVLQGDKAI